GTGQGVEQLVLEIGSDEIDAAAIGRRAGRLVGERVVGDGPWLAVCEIPGTLAARPDFASTGMRGLEDELLSIGGPVTAALGGWLAPSGQEGMKIAAVGLDFPEFSGLALGVSEGEAQTAAVGRPAQPKGETGSGNQIMRVAAISSDDGELGAVGDEQAAAIGHPCGVMGEDVGDAADIAAESGHNPQRLFGIGLEMAVNDEAGAVGRERADERRANLRGQLEVADFAIGEERDGE